MLNSIFRFNCGPPSKADNRDYDTHILGLLIDFVFFQARNVDGLQQDLLYYKMKKYCSLAAISPGETEKGKPIKELRGRDGVTHSLAAFVIYDKPSANFITQQAVGIDFGFSAVSKRKFTFLVDFCLSAKKNEPIRVHNWLFFPWKYKGAGDVLY